jgi:hypothetical protein
MSLLQQSGVEDSTSKQLTTAVTEFSSIAPPIPTNPSPVLVDILKLLKSELHQAFRTFPKSEYWIRDGCPSIRPSTSNNSASVRRI